MPTGVLLAVGSAVYLALRARRAFPRDNRKQFPEQERTLQLERWRLVSVASLLLDCAVGIVLVMLDLPLAALVCLVLLLPLVVAVAVLSFWIGLRGG